MQQVWFIYEEKESFKQKLLEFKNTDRVSSTGRRMFQIYSEILKPAVIQEVTDAIEECFPDIPYIGCSTSGNIIDCELAGGNALFHRSGKGTRQKETPETKPRIHGIRKFWTGP